MEQRSLRLYFKEDRHVHLAVCGAVGDEKHAGQFNLTLPSPAPLRDDAGTANSPS